MKKTLLITLFFFSIAINAQHKKGKEKIRALKIAYLTEKLDLTPNESEKFWPLFNQYQKKRRSLFSFERKQLKQRIEQEDTVNNLTDNEAQEILKKIHEFKAERYKHEVKFQQELVNILPAKKILILETTQRSFNKKLLNKLKDKSKE